MLAVAEGMKDGHAIRVGVRPLAVLGRNMGEHHRDPVRYRGLDVGGGRGRQPGVHGPEAIVDPVTFFRDPARVSEDVPFDRLVEVPVVTRAGEPIPASGA